MSSNIEITKICTVCGAEFLARTTKTLCCSHKCSSAAYKARKRADKVDAVKKEVAAIKAKPITDIKSKEYLSITEVCTLVGVSRWTVWRSIQQGELKAVKLGRRVIIRRADIETMFEPKYTPPQPTVEPISEWHTVQEVMQIYSMSKDSVYNHVRANHIPKKQNGRYVLISKKHFDDLFQPQNNKTT